MAQWIKLLAHKPEDLSSIPNTQEEKLGMAKHAVIQALGRQRQKDPWGFVVTQV